MFQPIVIHNNGMTYSCLCDQTAHGILEQCDAPLFLHVFVVQGHHRARLLTPVSAIICASSVGLPYNFVVL